VAALILGHYVAILAAIAPIVDTLLALARHAPLPVLVEEGVLVAMQINGIRIRDSRAKITAIVVTAAGGLIRDELVTHGQFLGATNVLWKRMVIADNILLWATFTRGHIEICASFAGVTLYFIAFAGVVHVAIVLVAEANTFGHNIAQFV